MDKAVERILKAIEEDEKITIYADYDADAVTACAVLYRGLKQLGVKNLGYYIPDRFDEGYGVNKEAVEKIVESGAKLIITVDCGTNSVEETTLANKLGMDVIITDHHEITGNLPKCVAVINHHRDGHHDLSGLTGVGTAYKLVQGLMAVLFAEEYKKSYEWQIPEIDFTPTETFIQVKRELYPHWEKWLLDLVAIGTVADVQSLHGENRILVKYGLQVLQKTRWIGLKQIMQNSSLDMNRKFDTFTIGFIIAPRINAASRIQHAEIAFKLLIGDNLEEVGSYAGQLESLNQHRQRLTEQIVSEAKAQAELQRDNKIILVVGEDWPKGVIGLVASRLSQEFYRPTVVLEKSKGHATGSARSIEQFDIVSAFSQNASYLERFGGHAQAAGLTIKASKIPKFHQSLLEFAHEKISDQDLVKTQKIDIQISPSELNNELVTAFESLEPFGAGNPSPTIMIEGLTLENSRTVGNTSKHLKIQASKDNVIINLIGFGFGPRINTFSPGSKFDVVAEPSINKWNGRSEIQLKIIDLKKSEN